MNIAIIGAAGSVGIAVHKELGDRGHRLRCVDRRRSPYDMSATLGLYGYEPTLPEAEWIYADVMDPDVAESVVEEMDSLVYLAMAASGGESDAEQFKVNLTAPYSLVEAGLKASLRQFVYASSGAVNPGRHPPVTEHDPPSPAAAYGMSKWLAEEMLRYYVQCRGLRAVCLRLGGVHPHRRRQMGVGKTYTNTTVDVRDVARAFRLAVEDERIRFDVLHVVSMGEPMRYDPTRAKEILGFEAQYKGSEHFADVARKQNEFLRTHQKIS